MHGLVVVGSHHILSHVACWELRGWLLAYADRLVCESVSFEGKHLLLSKQLALAAS